MKKLMAVVVALFLCLGVLVYVAADVNHGYGPGVVVEEEHGGHGDESGGHGESEEHGENNEEQEGEGH